MVLSTYCVREDIAPLIWIQLNDLGHLQRHA